MSALAPEGIPAEVRAAWNWADADVQPIAGGLINATYAVRRGGRAIAVVQRLHPIFAGEVNLDLERITTHLAARGLTTPRLVRTAAGAAWITVADRVWRALSWVDGIAHHAVPSLEHAQAGGELVGRFHRAVDDLDHTYACTRVGVHDTAGHLARLRERVGGGGDPEAVELGHAILAAAQALPPLAPTRPRHSHGDLKISNLLFAPGGEARGVALVDLDTLGLAPIGFELGDAMRSWCNPHGEDLGTIEFDLAVFAAAIGAWADVVGPLASVDERRSIVAGLETVCVELAARFATDAFDDRYFGWDAARFASRRDHNLIRSRGQLALAAAVRAVRAEALAIVVG